MGSLSLLQWIFPTQESNRGLLHCKQILYQLSYQGSPHQVRGENQFRAQENPEKPHYFYILRNGQLFCKVVVAVYELSDYSKSESICG